jgi:hypothetical protein
MRKLRRSSTGRGLAALGALVLATGSMVGAGPGGVALAASKTQKTTVPKTSLPAQARAPAASGQIAYISGDTLEVRDQATGQTTVKITSKTAITATVAVTLKAVAKGSCITASGTKAKNGALDASTVTLTATNGGKCGGGYRVPLGRGGGDFAPRSTGSSTPRRQFTPPANAATAFGKVTAVGGSKVTVDGTMFSFSAARRSSSKSKKATSTTVPKAKKLTVDLSSKTKYLKTGAGTAKSLKVGECATAFGSTSSIGAVTATRLSVSPATSAGCGFGGSFFGFGGSGFGGSRGAARGANG